MLTLEQINRASQAEFTSLLDGVYEHSPWIAGAAWQRKPPQGFSTLAALKHALVSVVREAGREAQEALVRAHPELAGKAMVSGALTAESSNEQNTAGLTHCTPEDFARIQQLNADYNARFGWPFILAVRGPRGTGLSRAQIIQTFERRLAGHPAFEFAECLRNIHRIAEIRLDDKFGGAPGLGNLVWDWAEALATHSDPGFKEQGQLTVTYLTAAHQACARQLSGWMRDSGFDEVSIDAVGNVVGVYHGTQPGMKRLLTGSHFDTVRNGGKYDGRLGILVPMAIVRELHQAGRRLPFGFEVVGFAEEEGQRYKATFLGSGALTGDFDPAWLDQQDADGVTMLQAMRDAGLPATLPAIQALRRDPAAYLGFVEVHIEQGPVLDELDLPLGVVTSINGGVRYQGEVIGTASHAGTTPMDRRRDAAAAVAELILYVEKRAGSVADVVGKTQEPPAVTVGKTQEPPAVTVGKTQEPPAVTVGTVGMLNVPAGSINVVPGRCKFSLDLRATTNAARDALVDDVRAELAAICQRRGLQFRLEETMRASAAPSAAPWQARWEAAVSSVGLPVFRMPSGAGHDAMKLHELMPQAMLFMRGGNAGISHNPLESISNHDTELCVLAFQHLLEQTAEAQP
jgi:beta-ureidopropionase / N-carbamoyl-L-amino-acid hydrolase